MLLDSKPICTKICRDLIGNFTSHTIGLELSTCDCALDTKCHIYRNRFKRCLTNTLTDNSNSCHRSLRQCKNRKSCKKLYTNWFNACGDLISGIGCPSVCIEAEHLLHQHKIGRKLKPVNAMDHIQKINFAGKFVFKNFNYVM